MGVIERIVNDLIDEHINYSNSSAKDFTQAFRDEIVEIDDQQDRIKIIRLALEQVSSIYNAHLLECTDVVNCPYNKKYDHITYNLQQELEREGVKIRNDSFTATEKHDNDEKFQEILKKLEEVQAGNEVLFQELEEMRELYFLGKKHWSQIFLGKLSDMTISGIISESLSKDILAKVTSGITTFLLNAS